MSFLKTPIEELDNPDNPAMQVTIFMNMNAWEKLCQIMLEHPIDPIFPKMASGLLAQIKHAKEEIAEHQFQLIVRNKTDNNIQ